MPKLLENEKLNRILFECRQKTIPEAILADIVDIIPIVGDISNAIRVKDAAEKNDNIAFALQSGDFILGIIPGVGEEFDIITPTNTILTIQKLLQENGQKSKIRKFVENIRTRR